MGIDRSAALMLAWAKQSGVDFSSTITLGKQKNYIPPDIKRKMRKWMEFSNKALSDTYIDQLIHELGSESVESMDYSEYEGASLIHDLNESLPDPYVEKFSLVIDSGTCEHISDIKNAVSCVKSMVKNQGHVIMISPANNWLGHGYYQLSPEFAFQNFSQGFEIIGVYISFKRMFSYRIFEIPNPIKVGRRLNINRKGIATLMFIARKSNEPKKNSSNQSDYELAWQKSKSTNIQTSLPLKLKESTIYSAFRTIYYRYQNRRALSRIRVRWTSTGATFVSGKKSLH